MIGDTDRSDERGITGGAAALQRPILCLVTDRHRLLARLGRQGDPVAAVVEQTRAAGCAGIDLVQVRERGLPDRELADLVERCVEVTRGTPTRVVVNDRVDIAVATGAAGVHLRSDSIEPRAVRRVVPRGFLVGRSVHDPDEVRSLTRTGDVDYLTFGTVFATVSKPTHHRLAGLAGLRDTVKATALPVLAIGGIGEGEVSWVAQTGAAGIAAIGLFLLGSGDDAAQELRILAERTRRLFDAAGSLI